MQNPSVGSLTQPQNHLIPFQFKAGKTPEITYVAPSVQSLLGWSSTDLLTTHSQWLNLVHSEHYSSLISQIYLLKEGQSIQCDYQIKNQIGHYQWVRSQFLRIESHNIVWGTWLDLSHSKQLDDQERRYTQLLENIVEAAHKLFQPGNLEVGMGQVLAKIGTVTNVDRAYFLGLDTASSQSSSLSLGAQQSSTPFHFFAWGRQGSQNQPPGQWLKHSFSSSTPHPIWQHLRQGQPLTGSVAQMPAEIAHHFQDHEVKSILLLPMLQNEHFFGVLGVENCSYHQLWTDREIHILEQLTLTLGTALKQFQMEARLSHYAFHDPLTELPNRALLLDRLAQCLRRKARQKSYSFAVVFLDLDRFKPVNDRLGHDIGDRLLIKVAQRISNFIRPGDTVARLGGDEFVILLEDVENESQADSVIKRLRSELTRCFLIDGNEIHIDASVGIALSSMEYKSADEILQKADLAMYRAKNAGKGCYRIFETSMHSQMMLKSDTESGMRQALKRNEFEVHYQPIVSLDSGLIQGFEALARWNHPKLGILEPSHFIPIAEETGMIKALGMQVLRIACQQTEQWQRHIPGCQSLSINVNLSAKQLAQKDLIQNITRILDETHFSASNLHLELTESFVIKRDSETLSIINQLKSLGIKIYLDDFGAGYSSLQYLNFFPIDGLKIDRMFTQKIPTTLETRAIVRSIIIMAQSLNMKIVVEGIETHQQIDYLNQFQDISGQGFLFSNPVSSERIQSLLIHKKSLI